MGRLSSKLITYPEQTTVLFADNELIVKGPKGELFLNVPVEVSFTINDSKRVISSEIIKQNKNAQSLLGTYHVLLGNLIKGVTEGFTKILDIEGIGYRAALEGNDIVLSLGYSHPIRFTPPEGIEIKVEKNEIRVSGIDKELVGHVAAKIRSFREPEPYKGKGIRYRGEVIQRKAGKKAGVGA